MLEGELLGELEGGDLYAEVEGSVGGGADGEEGDLLGGACGGGSGHMLLGLAASEASRVRAPSVSYVRSRLSLLTVFSAKR